MFQLWPAVFSYHLRQRVIKPYWRALRYGKFQARGLSCTSTFSICQDFLKSVNFMHKWGFVDSLTHTTVWFKELSFWERKWQKVHIVLQLPIEQILCHPIPTNIWYCYYISIKYLLQRYFIGVLGHTTALVLKIITC